jgi:peptide/nickel transport system ATP-binding protein
LPDNKSIGDIPIEKRDTKTIADADGVPKLFDTLNPSMTVGVKSCA